MKYRPYWQRILFLAGLVNLIFLFASASIFSMPEIKNSPPEDLLEIEWIETEETISNESASQVSAAETFPEIVLPPLEISHTIFEPLPKLEVAPPKEIPKVEEVKPPESEKIEQPAEKKSDNPLDKLKVIVKVYPKDIIPQFIQSGVAEENLKLKGEKISLSATITVEGKVRAVEIISGGDNGLLDRAVKNAAGGWIFGPYLDENGNPQELKTQIEFTQEDF